MKPREQRRSIRANFKPWNGIPRFFLRPLRRVMWLERMAWTLTPHSLRVQAGGYRTGTMDEQRQYRRVVGWCGRFWNVEHGLPPYHPEPGKTDFNKLFG